MTLIYPSLAAKRFCASARVLSELIEEVVGNPWEDSVQNLDGELFEPDAFGPLGIALTPALVGLKEGLYDYEKTLAFDVPRKIRTTA